MKKQRTWLATAIAFGAPLVAAAQANPAEAVSAAPPLRFQSAFSDYKPWQDIQPGGWRAIDESVRGTGSHAGHGAAPGSPPASAKPAGRPSPAAPAHHGHPPHGGRK